MNYKCIWRNLLGISVCAWCSCTISENMNKIIMNLMLKLKLHYSFEQLSYWMCPAEGGGNDFSMQIESMHQNLFSSIFTTNQLKSRGFGKYLKLKYSDDAASIIFKASKWGKHCSAFAGLRCRPATKHMVLVQNMLETSKGACFH